jgi:hypothetical protein
MEKLTRHNSFLSLKAEDKSSSYSELNKKMAQFRELLELIENKAKSTLNSNK